MLVARMYLKGVGLLMRNSKRNFPFNTPRSTLASQNTIEDVHAMVIGIASKL